MDADDRTVGQVLSRRQTLALLGAAGTALLSGCRPDVASAGPPAGPCVVRPEATEGPFFLDAALDRSDLRRDTRTGDLSRGVPLALTVGVTTISEAACVPLEGAVVHVWHCDARGVYSGIARESTDGQTFLRGFQRTDAGGEVRFRTVYPGWYPGRAVHIHLKVRTSDADAARVFTSQLYFPNTLSETVLNEDPAYRGITSGYRRNASDAIFRSQGGAQMVLSPTAIDASTGGYEARFDLAFDLTSRSG